MPVLYDYKCVQCGNIYEELVRSIDEPAECPTCGTTSTSPVSIQKFQATPGRWGDSTRDTPYEYNGQRYNNAFAYDKALAKDGRWAANRDEAQRMMDRSIYEPGENAEDATLRTQITARPA